MIMTELIHHKKNCSAEKLLKQIATRITMRPRGARRLVGARPVEHDCVRESYEKFCSKWGAPSHVPLSKGQMIFTK